MKSLLLATKNKGKAREIRAILPDWEVKTLDDIDFNDEIIEDGESFEENALIKARALQQSGIDCPILADDSGICIDYFDGKPGIYSSRFLGEDTPYYQKNKQILDMMKDVPEEKRGAHYCCAMILLSPNGEYESVFGRWDGRIARKAAGEGGFGYDPIFFLPDSACTAAEIPAYEKNKISHRAIALEKIKKILDSDFI